MNEFPDDFMDKIEKMKLEMEFQALDVQNTEGYEQWQIQLNQALGHEFAQIVWPDPDDFSANCATVQMKTATVQGPPKEIRVNVPLIHLRDLYEQKADPVATAFYLKAVMWDRRFRLWQHEENDEDTSTNVS